MRKSILLIAAAILTSTIALDAAKPKVIAHRGYWKTPGIETKGKSIAEQSLRTSAQNSLRSLIKADSIGCYASEFDVWMTPDSVIIVNHDPTINGIEIQRTPSSVVLKEKLCNGENVPTLDQYYKTAQSLETRLVCELKSHDSRSQEKAAAKRVVALAKKYGLEDRVDYIAFSKEAYKDLIKYAPKGAKVYFLNGDYVPCQIKFTKGAGIDYSMKVMKKHPEWIKECHDKGLEVNVWTVNSPEDIQWCIDNGVDYITTNEPERVQKMIK